MRNVYRNKERKKAKKRENVCVIQIQKEKYIIRLEWKGREGGEKINN